MTTFQKITLIGKGLFGSVVLSELASAGFEVTLLSRSEKPDEVLPDGVHRVVADYSDVDSLTKALSGQDAVVSTITTEAALSQKIIIDAAIKAHVKRFIPSDFGSLTTDPAASHFPHHVNFVEIQNYLKSKSDKIEYTIFSIGAFTEFLVNYGVIFDWPNKTAEIWGDGTTPLSTTSLSGSARAIVGALKNPETTKNKNLFIHEHVVTQAQLLGLAKKYSPGVEWAFTTVEDPEAELDRLEALTKKQPEFSNLLALTKATFMSGKYQAAYKNVDNDLVGVPVLTEGDLEAIFAKAYGS